MISKVAALHLTCLLNKNIFYLVATIDRLIEIIKVVNDGFPVFLCKQIKIIDERVDLFLLFFEDCERLTQFLLCPVVTTIQALTYIFNWKTLVGYSIISIPQTCIIEIIRNHNGPGRGIFCRL